MPKKKKKRAGSSSRMSLPGWRVGALFLLFVLLSAGIAARLYFLQVVRGDYYAALARGQGVETSAKPLERGDIYFRDQAGADVFPAATTRDAPLVYAVPREVKDVEDLLGAIGDVLEFSNEERETVKTRLENENSSFALIARDVPKDRANIIKGMKVEGVHVRTESARHYPADKIAANVLGFLGFAGEERTGQYGVEEFYNKELSGGTANPSLIGKILPGDNKEPADIKLTIDYGAQFVIEKKVRALAERFGADSASAIFMDPKTGEVIAMVNVPGFNPNKYREAEDIDLFNNTSVQSMFEFGSVFKPITMAAAIDAGAITPQTTYEDKGSVRIGSHTIRNSDGKTHGVKTMTEVLELSLNTGVIFAQEHMGKQPFRKYMEGFGLDTKTGIDLPGEVSGNIKNIKNTNRDINFATAAFGQGISFTPVRLLASISAIANDGKIMKPFVVSELDFGGSKIETEPEVAAQPISSMTASRVTAMMVSVVENGFGNKAAVPGYTVAGKTGTAQIPNENGPGYSDRTLHSFVGFAPAYNPRFIGMITLENPKGIRFSSDSVAPTFGEVSSFLLQYYNIPPQ